MYPQPYHRYTAQDQLRSLQRERREQLKCETIEREVKSVFMYQANLNRGDLLASKRNTRNRMEQQMEMEYEESIAKAKREKDILEQQKQQEEALAIELQRVKLEKEREEKMRQQIRETSMELRELQKQLQAAYGSKELVAQMAEKEARKADEKTREMKIVRAMAEKREREEEEERRLEVERQKAIRKYFDDLDVQIKEQFIHKENKDDETQRDKMLVDEILRKIYAEDMKDKERKRLCREALYQQMLQDQQNSIEKRKDESRRAAIEDEQIARVAHELALRDEQRKAAKSNDMEQRERVQRDIAAKIAAKDERERELDELRLVLSQDENQEKERLKELNEEQKRRRMMAELQDAMLKAGIDKDEKRHAELEREQFYVEQMMAQFAEENRIEREKREKQRREKVELRQMADKLLAEKERNEQLRREKEWENMKDEKRMSEFQAKIIEEERQRMLCEHAHNLIGHLPKGVIRGEKDLDLLGEEFRKAYAKPASDPFSQTRCLTD